MDQQSRFEEMRELLVEQNAFYRERLRGAKEFASLPFTTKSELVEDQAANPPFGTDLTYPVSGYTRIHQTSGTAGKPLLWLDTPESWDWWLRCWEHVYRGAGVERGDRVYLAFSFGPFIGFWTAFEAAQRLGVMAISGGGLTTEQRVLAMLERKASVLACTPTYALRLADTACGMGIDLSQTSIRITIHAGEPGAGIPSTRQRIQDAFGARSFDHVGMTEIGAYGFECEAQAGPHIIEDEFIAEVIHPHTLGPVKPGEKGELVLTNLGRLGMPLVRYRTGDLVVLSSEPCVCGRRWPRLVGGVLGRADDMMTVRGVNVFPAAIENIVRRHPEVIEFAIEVYRKREMDELILKVELDPGADPSVTTERLRRDSHRELYIRAAL